MSTPSNDDDARRPRRPSTNREPAVPPSHMLQQVNGRVLDPGTALTIKDVTPQSTVYVGPRLTISRSSDVPRVIAQLREVADELGWDLGPTEGSTERSTEVSLTVE